jgi:predicted permease
VKSLVAIGLDGIPRLNDVAVDGGVIAFAFVLSLGTGIVFGAVPAWTMSGLSYVRAHAGDRSSGSSGQRVRQGAVIVQVAVAQILLVAAALLVGSLQRLMAVDPGFQTESRMAFRVSLPSVTYPSPESQVAFFEQLISRLESRPGVRSAGISTLSPFDVINETATFHVEGYEEPAGSKPLGSEPRRISAAYPASIGMPLIAGRTFDDRDRIGSPYVVMVDQGTAERFWPGQSPLGKRLRFGTAWREVVGVVGTVKNERLDAEGQHQIYIPFTQFPERNMVVVMHADTSPAAAIRSAADAVASLDRSVPVFDVRTLEERVRQSLAPRRYSMMLLAGFGLSGLLVAIIGIYGVIAYSVRQRSQEIGIRLALGAQRRQLMRSIVGQGMILGVAGIGIGAAGAFWLTRFMESMLYGVTATDPLTFILVATALLTAAALAAFVPANKASRLDPARILRSD